MRRGEGGPEKREIGTGCVSVSRKKGEEGGRR